MSQCMHGVNFLTGVMYKLFLCSTFQFLCDILRQRKHLPCLASVTQQLSCSVSTMKPHSTVVEAPPSTSSTMDQKVFQEEEEEDAAEYYHFIPKAVWFTKILSFQADVIYNCIMTILSPFLGFFSSVTESYRSCHICREVCCP